MASLTRAMKETLVRLILGDLPKIDYRDRIQALAEMAALQDAPETIKQAWAAKDKGRSRAWVETHTVYFDLNTGHSQGFTVPYSRGLNSSFTASILCSKVPELKEAVDAQAKLNKERTELKIQLLAQFQNIRTTKQFREVSPEFSVYLPEDPPKVSRLLPACSNLMADLTKAGWPVPGSRPTKKIEVSNA